MDTLNPEPQKIHALEQRTAVVREVVPMSDLQGFFGRAFGTVTAAAQAQNAHLAGPPFARYHGMPGQTIDVEAGFPIVGHFKATEEVQESTLPATEAFEAVHMGSYDTLNETYGLIQQRMQAEGSTPADTMWEFYLSGPATQTSPSSWLTRVVWPIT